MKFLSFNNFIYIILSALCANLWFDITFGKYLAIGLLFYGIFMINWRIMIIMEKLNK